MKYIKEYLREKLLIEPLGEVTLEENYSSDGTVVGQDIIIDNVDVGITVWYADYSAWIEKKYKDIRSLTEKEEN